MSISNHNIFGFINDMIKISVLAVGIFLLTACSALEGEQAQRSPEEVRIAEEGEEKLSISSNVLVGFSQLGAESDWRSAHSQSIRSALVPGEGFDLLFEDGQQKQTNQIMAIRTFIQRGVDVIAVAPVTENGWDSVLSEAGEAHIPVILVDRMVDTDNEELFSCWIGSDFELEGKKATEWLYQYTKKIGFPGEKLNIVNIQGTIGSSAQIGRSKGLRQACDRHKWNLLQEVSGEFTQAKGREVMASLLRLYPNLNVVYCENDNEALGAIEAIEAAGLKPGIDLDRGQILILSFDGMNEEAVQYCREGKIACIAECNPQHGEPLAKVIRQIMAGEQPEKYSYIEEKIFSGCPKVKNLKVDGVDYQVTMLE